MCNVIKILILYIYYSIIFIKLKANCWIIFDDVGLYIYDYVYVYVWYERKICMYDRYVQFICKMSKKNLEVVDKSSFDFDFTGA